VFVGRARRKSPSVTIQAPGSWRHIVTVSLRFPRCPQWTGARIPSRTFTPGSGPLKHKRTGRVRSVDRARATTVQAQKRGVAVALPHLTGEMSDDEDGVEIRAGRRDCCARDCRFGRRFRGQGQEGGRRLHAGRAEDRGLRAGRLHDAALLGRRKVASVAGRVLAALVPEVVQPSSDPFE